MTSTPTSSGTTRGQAAVRRFSVHYRHRGRRAAPVVRGPRGAPHSRRRPREAVRRWKIDPDPGATTTERPSTGTARRGAGPAPAGGSEPPPAGSFSIAWTRGPCCHAPRRAAPAADHTRRAAAPGSGIDGSAPHQVRRGAGVVASQPLHDLALDQDRHGVPRLARPAPHPGGSRGPAASSFHPTPRRLRAGVRHALDFRSRLALDQLDRLGR